MDILKQHMEHYIDAEKLKAEIETKRDIAKNFDMSGGYALIYDELLILIKFLQQEQSELPLENNGWIDCRKQMPKETKQWSDTSQGHREWTESDLVLAWDSMYGCRVDATKNGKWMSEQRGGYTGQVIHGIIAWRPIPEFNEELLFNARKEK